MGSVHQRWLTRPFVPFPEELKPQDRDYYRKFQFQALTEARANDLSDMQASRVFSGWGGQFIVSRVMNSLKSSVSNARNSVSQLLKSNLKPDLVKEFQLLDLRLQALEIVCNNSRNAISYQAQVDKVKANKYGPDPIPDIGTSSSGERSLILETARQEIDNTALLIQQV